jgi:hypothetical protein
MEYPPSCWLIREAGLFETAVARPAGNLSVEVLAKVPYPKTLSLTLKHYHILLIIYYINFVHRPGTPVVLWMISVWFFLATRPSTFLR